MTPHSPDAEEALLSSFLISPLEVGGLCAEKCDSEHFFVPRHIPIFENLMEMWKENTLIDLVTVVERLRGKNLLEQVGGPAFLTELYGKLPTAANATVYLEILREKRALRKVRSVCWEFGERAQEEPQEVPLLLSDFESRVLEIGNRQSAAEPTFHDLVFSSMRRYQEAFDRGGRLRGLSTGIDALDDLTSGLCSPELIVISAETSGGKTALALRMVESISIDNKLPSLIFSYEMDKDDLSDRIFCSRARADLAHFRRGKLINNSFRFPRVIEDIAAAPIFIHDDSDTQITQMRAKARRLKRKHGLGAVFVDYLQLIPSNGNRENREQQVAQISRGLKAMAKELQVPVVALSQLNDDGKVRESRAIAHDADKLIIIQQEQNDNEKQPRHYLRIAKQRNGPRDRVQVAFLAECARFENLTNRVIP